MEGDPESSGTNTLFTMTIDGGVPAPGFEPGDFVPTRSGFMEDIDSLFSGALDLFVFVFVSMAFIAVWMGGYLIYRRCIYGGRRPYEASSAIDYTDDNKRSVVPYQLASPEELQKISPEELQNLLDSRNTQFFGDILDHQRLLRQLEGVPGEWPVVQRQRLMASIQKMRSAPLLQLGKAVSDDVERALEQSSQLIETYVGHVPSEEDLLPAEELPKSDYKETTISKVELRKQLKRETRRAAYELLMMQLHKSHSPRREKRLLGIERRIEEIQLRLSA